MVSADDKLLDQGLIALDCGFEPFIGQRIFTTDAIQIFLRAIDSMIIFYDGSVKECWEMDDPDELRDYLNDYEYSEIEWMLKNFYGLSQPAVNIPPDQ